MPVFHLHFEDYFHWVENSGLTCITFIPLKMSFCCLLVTMASVKKFAYNWSVSHSRGNVVPLNNALLLSCFQEFFLVSSSLTMKFLGVVLFILILFGVCFGS